VEFGQGDAVVAGGRDGLAQQAGVETAASAFAAGAHPTPAVLKSAYNHCHLQQGRAWGAPFSAAGNTFERPE
jgi:hypothetical protein